MLDYNKRKLIHYLEIEQPTRKSILKPLNYYYYY